MATPLALGFAWLFAAVFEIALQRRRSADAPWLISGASVTGMPKAAT